VLVQNTEQQCSPEMTTAPDAASCLMLLQAECCQQNACSHGCNAHRLHARVFTCILSEKKRKDYALRRQFNEKPNIILGCPGMHPFTPGLLLQGALSSSSTLAQLRAFAKIRAKDVGSDRDLDWEVLYLALRCGHSDEAIKVQHSSKGCKIMAPSLYATLPGIHCLISVYDHKDMHQADHRRHKPYCRKHQPDCSGLAVGTSQSAVGTSQFAVGTSQIAVGASQSVIPM